MPSQKLFEVEKLKQSGLVDDVTFIKEDSLGDPSFRRDYNVRYCYVVGSMYRGISSEEMVISLGQRGILGFYGTGGLKCQQVKKAIHTIQAELSDGMPYGMNLLHDESHPEREDEMVELFLNYGINNIEASAFMYVTVPLVRYRAQGLSRAPGGEIVINNRIIAKLSRPEVAQSFLSPAPEVHIKQLLQQGLITTEQAEILRVIPMTDDICVESDSGGHTDGACALVALPTMLRLRDRAMEEYDYRQKVRIGAAGGIGTPEAAAASFVLGADFILTGSINQCTVEAGTSDNVKDLLQAANIQDTTYAPAGDLFETGAKVQVLNRGLLFPARANKLYGLYCHFGSLDEVDSSTLSEIQDRYFKRSLKEVYDEIKAYYPFDVIQKIELSPKRKMAIMFSWYMRLTTRLAIKGVSERRVDFQIHCGPAMGAFNQWVKGTKLEDWRGRHVADIADLIMSETTRILSQRMRQFASEVG